MTSRFFQLVLVAVLFLSLLKSAASSMMCYNCTSVSDSRCNNPFDGRSPLVKCPDLNICFKQIVLFEVDSENSQKENLSPLGIVRGCASPNFCNYVKNVSTDCFTCGDHDACNSVSVALPSFILISLYVVKCFIN